MVFLHSLSYLGCKLSGPCNLDGLVCLLLFLHYFPLFQHKIMFHQSLCLEIQEVFLGFQLKKQSHYVLFNHFSSESDCMHHCFHCILWTNCTLYEAII